MRIRLIAVQPIFDYVKIERTEIRGCKLNIHNHRRSGFSQSGSRVAEGTRHCCFKLRTDWLIYTYLHQHSLDLREVQIIIRGRQLVGRIFESVEDESLKSG